MDWWKFKFSNKICQSEWTYDSCIAVITVSLIEIWNPKGWILSACLFSVNVSPSAFHQSFFWWVDLGHWSYVSVGRLGPCPTICIGVMPEEPFHSVLDGAAYSRMWQFVLEREPGEMSQWFNFLEFHLPPRAKFILQELLHFRVGVLCFRECLIVHWDQRVKVRRERCCLCQPRVGYPSWSGLGIPDTELGEARRSRA